MNQNLEKIAIIGGTGMTALHDLQILHRQAVYTPYGEPSGPLVFGRIHEREICFIPRHGHGHHIPPHLVNYRANIWALHEAGIKNVIAVNAVGGIAKNTPPGRIVIPNQIIDYSYNREQTFSDGKHQPVEHIDFTNPYTESLRQKLIAAAYTSKLEIVEHGVYASTQGPRLETAA
ncbi:MAG: S-methyl-5'-thioinosine phosphorylase, partial [Gammaproteobacteria bacterium]|nr:S-methyl-5'-thioinosine phosphorylase [Gammaproteobacteria bacterium]